MTEKWKDGIFLFVVVVVFLCFVAFLVFGCASVNAKVPVVMSDETIQFVELNYTRWWNQSIGSFVMNTPSGWLIELEKQNAANTASFSIGPYAITIGEAVGKEE